MKIIWQVQTLAQARDAAQTGVDMNVAQSTQAGGHGGARSTLTLVPAVVDAIAPLAVVAADGIADGRGLAAAHMLGAAGVLIGTRFFAGEAVDLINTIEPAATIVETIARATDALLSAAPASTRQRAVNHNCRSTRDGHE